MKGGLYKKILTDRRSGIPRLAVLIDPEKFDPAIIEQANLTKTRYIFIGGSTVNKKEFDKVVLYVKKKSPIPVVLFPGDENQINGKADALLFLSLLSGRNPEYLIEKQIIAAPEIIRKKIESISTAYLLVRGGRPSAAEVISGTDALDPKNKKKILHTVQAAILLGFQAIYLEAGSGAREEVPSALIRFVAGHCSKPLIVGGGIDSPQKARAAVRSGADIVVVGNALEGNHRLLPFIAEIF